MRSRTWKVLPVWALVVAGCTSSGAGCGGCAPIPGGFPPQKRQPNAVTAKLTPAGLDFIKAQLATIVGAAGGALSSDVPCTDSTQNFNIGFGLNFTVDVFICDMNGDYACTATDDDPASRVDEPGHGRDCSIAAAVDSIDLAPNQAADGTVNLVATLKMKINTGKLFLNMKIPGVCSNGLRCSVEYDSDESPPPDLPIAVTLNLKVDPNYQDILAIGVTGLSDISQSIDSSELHFRQESGSCSLGITCSILDIDQVKQQLFQQLQGKIARTLNDSIDKLRCQACDAVTGACPTGSQCVAAQGVCYSNYAPSDDPTQDKRDCPPTPLGAEGRIDLGATLAPLGGPESAPLDTYLVAGGRNPDGSPATSVQSGGVVLGLMGGTDAPVPAMCVPPSATFPARPPQDPMDFDAEAALAPAVGPYALGLAVSDDYLDKSFYDLWTTGAICLNVSTATTTLLSSSLFGTFISTLPELTHGDDVPMLIALRPHEAPNVVIGKGTTKVDANGNTVPDDPLLTVHLDSLQLDFYAFIEERYSRLFSLTADVALPLSLDFDAQARTVTPLLGSLDALLTNVHATNVELLGDDPATLEQIIPSLVALIQPQLAGALSPIALPALSGYDLDVVAARGSVPYATEPGFQQLALFTNLAPSAQPLVLRTDTDATLVAATMPSADDARHGARPVAHVRASARGPHPIDETFEYDWRVDGGFWSTWQKHGEFDLSPAILALQGRHDIELRSRLSGDASSTDLEPAHLPFVVDYDPPAVRLELDADARQVETIAHDAVTADDALTFRYRVSGAAWSEPGPKQAFSLDTLGDNPSLEVEAIDEAGHAARATFGIPADQNGAPSTPATHDSAGGCATVPMMAFALIGLLARRRRARS